MSNFKKFIALVRKNLNNNPSEEWIKKLLIL